LALQTTYHIVSTCCWLLVAICFFLGPMATSAKNQAEGEHSSIFSHVRMITIQSTIYAVGGLLLTVSFVIRMHLCRSHAGNPPHCTSIMAMVIMLCAYLTISIIVPLLGIHRHINRPEKAASTCHAPGEKPIKNGGGRLVSTDTGACTTVRSEYGNNNNNQRLLVMS